MIKRIITLAVSITLSIGATIGLAVLGNHMDFFQADEHSETFAGYVSTEEYENREAAARGFLKCELTGSTLQPEYKGYTKICNLGSNEINALGVSDLTEKKIVEGEQVSIEFTHDSIESKANTYLLQTSDAGFVYFVPPQETGEALTNSYFESVLDGKKYSNCTSITTVNLRLVSSATVPVDSTYRQAIYFDDEKAFFNQELPGYDTDFYFIEDGDSIIAYMEHPSNKDGKFYTLSEINSSSGMMRYEVYLMKGGNRTNIEEFSSIQDIVDIMFMMELDASYFVKTDVGFSMTDEKYKEVCKMMAGEDFFKEIEDAWTDFHIHFRSDYYVTDGRLSASKTVLTMSNGDEIFALTLETKYSDFGTTEVEMPR